MEAGGGIEPPIEDLQSPALPLCYPAALGTYPDATLWSMSCAKIPRIYEIKQDDCPNDIMRL